MIGEIHHVRGRLRIRIPDLKRDEKKARAVKRLVENEPGVRSAEVNILTGSLLVFYDPRLLDAISLLAILGVEAAHRRVQDLSLRERKLSTALFWWAVEKVVERSIPLLIGAML